MKVLLLNGSPNAEACVYTALMEVGKSLRANGVDYEILQLGKKPVPGCTGCGKCKAGGGCVFQDEVYKAAVEKMREADGLIVGSPVYFSGPNGSLCALLDRLFYSQAEILTNKPAAAVVSCRRGGASATFERLNQYFAITQMPIVTSQYWNSVHGHTAEDVRKDEEGLQTMRTLGNNMAWMLKTLHNGGVPFPAREPRLVTNFIR